MKIILCCLFFCLTVKSYSQQTSPLPLQTSSDFLKKSKKQKRTAWIMLGTGVAMTAVGIPLMAHGRRQEGFMAGVGEYLGGLGLTIGGGVLGSTSILFFNASSKNKKRAATVSGFLQLERTQVLQAAALKSRSYPAATLRLQWP